MGFVTRLFFWGGFTTGIYQTYKMFPTLMQKGLLAAGSTPRGRSVLRTLPSAQRTAERYLAGNTLDQAMTIAMEINARQKAVSMSYLTDDQYGLNAIDNRNQIGEMIVQLMAQKINADVTISPSSLGMHHHSKLALQNLLWLLEKADKTITLWLDAEDHTRATDVLALYFSARDAGYDNVGITIQGNLYRSWGDINKIAALATAKVRVVLGILHEPSEHGFPEDIDSKDNLVRLALFVIQQGHMEAAIVSYDEMVIQGVMDGIRAEKLEKNAAEFVIPYGVRPELQAHLIIENYPVRVYMPWGNAWEQYLTQRLAADPSEAIMLLVN